MKAINCICIIVLTTIQVSVSGQSDISITNRLIGDFTGISVTGNYKVIIEEGDSSQVRIDAPLEIQDRVVTIVKHGILKIRNKHDNWSLGEKSWYSDKSWWHHHPEIVVYVTARKLKSVRSAGSAKILFNKGLQVDDFSIGMLGSGVMEGTLTATGSVRAHLTGSAALKISGIFKNSNLHMTGSGHFDGAGLVTENVFASFLGSGCATIFASKSIKAHLVGSSALSYCGAPKISSKKVGSGSISNMLCNGTASTN